MIYLSMHSSVQTSAKNSPIRLKDAVRLCNMTENLPIVDHDDHVRRVELATGGGGRGCFFGPGD